MTDEKKETPELVMPRFLSDIKGTEREVRLQKVELIKKFGFREFEQLVLRSSTKSVR